MSNRACWLLKTEPDAFSFGDLLAAPGQTVLWDGVRNYQARNFLGAMKPGDRVLVYHSSIPQPAVVGLAEVAAEGVPDPSQFDPDSPAYDAKATPETPRWVAVPVRGLRHLPRPVTLHALKRDGALAGMQLLRRGNRLSVLPLTEVEFARVLALSEEASGI